jgi:hypothetical protein
VADITATLLIILFIVTHVPKVHVTLTVAILLLLTRIIMHTHTASTTTHIRMRHD